METGIRNGALFTLALGAGATTVMFTAVNGVLLKPLPYPAPDRLLRLREKTDCSTQFGNLWGFTYLNYRDCVRACRSIDLAGWRFGGGTLSKPGEPEIVEGREISSNPGGAPPAIILGHGLWPAPFCWKPWGNR